MTRGEIRQSRYVKRYLRKDGRVIYVEVLRSPARDADGNILYFVISERDITDERALDRATLAPGAARHVDRAGQSRPLQRPARPGPRKDGSRGRERARCSCSTSTTSRG